MIEYNTEFTMHIKSFPAVIARRAFLKKALALCLMLIFPAIAMADQAAYIKQTEANRAVALLKTQKQIKHFCNPCDDKTVRAEDVNTVEAVPTGDENTWEVKVNGTGIDLAYVYFQDKKGRWKNVAKELHIKVDDVPKFLPEDK